MGAYADHLKDDVMAYAQREDMDKPWWFRLGMKIGIIKDGDSIDDICTKAGLAFDVGKRPVFMQNATGEYVRLNDFVATVREDSLHDVNKAALGIVSPDWKGPSPRELFGVLEKGLAANRLKPATAMSMKGGRLIVGSALLTNVGTVGADRIRNVLTICTNNAGEGATRIGVNDIVAVCENTSEAGLALAGQRGLLIRVPHRSKFVGADIASVLEANDATLSARIDVYNKLLAAKISDDEIADFFARDVLLIDPADLNKTDGNGKPLISTRTRNMFATLCNAYKNGPGANDRIGTAWGAWNAVTYFVDRESGTRDTTGDGEVLARMYTAQFGKGATVKKAALEAIAKRVKVALAA